jgi:hypothetical protein
MEKTRLFAGQFFLGFRALAGIRFFRGELPQRFEISHRALELAQRIEERAQMRDFLDVVLRAFAIRPEIGCAHSLLERAELAF